MKYWKMKLTCQSPVHIGSGDIYQKNQYVYEEDGKRAHIYFLNESKWAEFLENEKLLDSFVSEIHRKFIHFSIYDFLNAYRGNNCQPESLKGLMKKLVDSGVLLKPETADVPYSKNPRNALNDIHTFIKDSEGRMYIPGSSLKGAFRTAIIATMIRKDRRRYEKCWNEIFNIAKRNYHLKRNIGNVLDKLEKEVFIPQGTDGKRNMVNSYLRGLTVGDSTAATLPGLIVQKADLGETEERPHTISLWRECMAPGDTVTFKLGIDSVEMKALGISDAKGLIQCLQDFVGFQCNLLGESFGGKKEIQEIQEMRHTDLLLGGGAGFLSKTVIYALAPDVQSGLDVVKRLMAEQFKRGHHDQREHISPHTLKLAKRGNSYQVMGMCKLEMEEELC